MKKVNTVKAHREFDRIIRHGKAIKTPHFSMYFTPSELDHVRVGISVGKKNGIAVRRVRIKRQVRAMVEKADILGLPLDVIIAVRPTYDPEEYSGLEGELLASLTRMKETIH
ncbi:MAG: ribonuclease P protein component [Bacilli bacterium]|nr:ribonuclease P protein component [Bacilli bacterium]